MKKIIPLILISQLFMLTSLYGDDSELLDTKNIIGETEDGNIVAVFDSMVRDSQGYLSQIVIKIHNQSQDTSYDFLVYDNSNLQSVIHLIHNAEQLYDPFENQTSIMQLEHNNIDVSYEMQSLLPDSSITYNINLPDSFDHKIYSNLNHIDLSYTVLIPYYNHGDDPKNTSQLGQINATDFINNFTVNTKEDL